jgi:hypothetical protein
MVSIDGRERGQLEAPETNNLRDNEVHKRNGVAAIFDGRGSQQTGALDTIFVYGMTSLSFFSFHHTHRAYVLEIPFVNDILVRRCPYKMKNNVCGLHIQLIITNVLLKSTFGWIVIASKT